MTFPDWAKNILFLLVYTISGLILVLIIEGLLSGTELIPLNTAIESVVTEMRTPFLTSFLVVITRLSDPFFLLFVGALIFLVLIIKRRFYDAVVFATALLVATVSLTVLKNTFQVVRPNFGILNFEGWSFPSGHATIATAFFFMLAYTFFKKINSALGKIVLIAGSIFMVALICFTRIYLGAHWSLDILGGVALGLLSVSFSVLMFNLFVENRRSLKDRIGF